MNIDVTEECVNRHAGGKFRSGNTPSAVVINWVFRNFGKLEILTVPSDIYEGIFTPSRFHMYNYLTKHGPTITLKNRMAIYPGGSRSEISPIDPDYEKLLSIKW